jgi:alkyldihydroxyacetonephosphate synthase
VELKCDEINFNERDRLFHSHGHTLNEIFWLRHKHLERIVDAVVYTKSHEEVEEIVKLANQYNVVIIPFGGGTSVTNALSCPKNEERMIISLDLSRMNKIKWIDRKSMTICVEAGMIGSHLEAKLSTLGLTVGHEPVTKFFK